MFCLHELGDRTGTDSSFFLFTFRFVSSIVSLYYGSDNDVVQDSELQAWIKDVVEEGFVNVPHFG